MVGERPRSLLHQNINGYSDIGRRNMRDAVKKENNFIKAAVANYIIFITYHNHIHVITNHEGENRRGADG